MGSASSNSGVSSSDEHAASRDYGDLFPLRLSSMEVLHLFDRRDGDPNFVYARLSFSGQIDRIDFESAVEVLARRQPLISALVREHRSWWYWVQGAPSPIVSWYRPGEPATTEDLDVFREPGFRLHVWQHEDETEVLLQIHHVLMDGASAIASINDLLSIYHNLQSGNPPQQGLKRNEPQLLRGRNRLDLFSRRYLRHLYKQPVALFGAWNFIFRKFTTLIPNDGAHRNAKPNQRGTPAIYGEWLPDGTASFLDEVAAGRRITANTLLMAKLFCSVQYWRSQRFPTNPKSWFRVILPMNMRSVSDRMLPATNRTTVMVFDRQKHHMDAWPLFLKYLDREVRLIQNWHLQRMFLLFVRCMSFPRFRLVRSAKNDKPRGTIILTNLGTPFRWSRKQAQQPQLGNLALVDFDFVGPVRIHTPVNFTIQRHGDRMRLSLHYDPGQIDQQEAKALFMDFRHQLTTDPFGDAEAVKQFSV